jgi:hypothetical protein
VVAQALVTHCANELTAGEYIQSPEEILASPEKFERINAIMRCLLDRLAL